MDNIEIVGVYFIFLFKIYERNVYPLQQEHPDDLKTD